MKPVTFFLTLIGVVWLSSCNHNPVKYKEQGADLPAEGSYPVKYARGFTVTEAGGYKLVEVQDPIGESETVYKYAFVSRGSHPATIPEGYTVIETPVRRLICMTSLQLSNFIKLDALNRVVGITSTRFLFDEQIKQQLNKGETAKIGIEGNFDTEMILALEPDIILVSPFKRGGYEAIRNLDIPLVSFLGYKESSPLGQAEWIKFTALLLGMEEEAGSLFDAIETEYLRLQELAGTVARRPVVLSGEMHSGNWYVAGGNSYLAQLFRDAGADYFRKNQDESGGFYVDFETVYSEAAHADYWRLVNSYNGAFTYDALRQSDARYTDFKAYREKQVLYCNLREKPFYERTPVEPEVVLADLIHIFHPDLLPAHTPVYYELLR